MSFPNKEDRLNCWSRRDEYWRCLDEGKSQAECTKFREQYEKFCPSQWVCIADSSPFTIFLYSICTLYLTLMIKK